MMSTNEMLRIEEENNGLRGFFAALLLPMVFAGMIMFVDMFTNPVTGILAFTALMVVTAIIAEVAWGNDEESVHFSMVHWLILPPLVVSLDLSGLVILGTIAEYTAANPLFAGIILLVTVLTLLTLLAVVLWRVEKWRVEEEMEIRRNAAEQGLEVYMCGPWRRTRRRES